jgi:hypothetical protein
MTAIVYFACGLLLLAATIKLLSWRLVSNWFSSQNSLLSKAPNRVKAVLIIPIFQEQEIIEESLSHIEHTISTLPHLEISAYFVASERESYNDGTPTTYDKLQELMAHRKESQHRIFALKAPSRRQWMAGQINYAIEYLRCNGKPRQHWV